MTLSTFRDNISQQIAQKLTKPMLRGHFHQAAFFIACGACAMLISQSVGDGVKLASSIIYTIGLTLLFGISALYHRPNWKDKSRQLMRRLDHSAIYVLIASTATPICLLGLEESAGRKLMLIFWLSAFIGIFQSIVWIKAPKVISAGLYLIMGWMVIPYFSEFAQALNSVQLGLFFSGGAVYTIGALVYAFKRPNPFPKVFGYHEIFHLLVVIAAILHFIVITQLIYR